MGVKLVIMDDSKLYISGNLPSSLAYGVGSSYINANPSRSSEYYARESAKDYPPRVSKYFKLKHLEDYFTPAYISIFFNGISVSDATILEYTFNDNKLPVYGYGDRFFSSIEEGHYLVSGHFGLLYKEVAYLPVLLDALNGNRNWLKVPGLTGGMLMTVDAWLRSKLSKYKDSKGNWHETKQFTDLFNTVLQRLSRVMGVSTTTFNKWLKTAYDSKDRIHAAMRLLQLYKGLFNISLDEKFSDYDKSMFSPYMDIFSRKDKNGNLVYNAFMSSYGSLKTPASPIFWSENGITHQISTKVEMEELFTESSIEGLWEILEDAVWGYAYKDYPGIPPIMEHDFAYDTKNRPDMETFDIIIRYGEEGSTYTDHTIQVINNVHITSSSQSINVSSPDDILDIYEFFAESMNRKVVQPDENRYINIPTKKTGLGYVDTVGSSFFDEGGNFFNEQKNILVKFDKEWVFDLTLENNIYSQQVSMRVPANIFYKPGATNTNSNVIKEGVSILYIMDDTTSFSWGPFHFPHDIHIMSSEDSMTQFYNKLDYVLTKCHNNFRGTSTSSGIIDGVFDKLVNHGFFNTSIKDVNAEYKACIMKPFVERFIYSDGLLDLPKDYYTSTCNYINGASTSTFAPANIIHDNPSNFSKYNDVNYIRGLLKITVPCEDLQYRELATLGIIFKRSLFLGEPNIS